MIDVTERKQVIALGHVDGLSGRSDKGLDVVHVLVVPKFKLLLVVLNLIMRQDRLLSLAFVATTRGGILLRFRAAK